MEQSRKPQLLVVDDQKGITALLEALFEPMGYDVLVAADGASGLDLARERRPEVIILDWVLPRLSGRDVLAALKADPRTSPIPVIVLTGLQAVIDPRIITEGQISCLAKPFDLEALISLVAEKTGRGVSSA